MIRTPVLKVGDTKKTGFPHAFQAIRTQADMQYIYICIYGIYVCYLC